MRAARNQLVVQREKDVLRPFTRGELVHIIDDQDIKALVEGNKLQDSVIVVRPRISIDKIERIEKEHRFIGVTLSHRDANGLR